MEEEYPQEESEIINQSEGLDEALDHMKKTLHEMKLQDAIHRQDIRKLEKGNDRMEKKIEELKTTAKKLEKQKAIDEQYLKKQQEVITKSEMAQNLDACSTSKSKAKIVTIGKEYLV